jgi:hypothetical protein
MLATSGDFSDEVGAIQILGREYEFVSNVPNSPLYNEKVLRALDAAEAEALLEAVTAYLRLAQQRGSSEPGRISAALDELKQACASRVGEPPQHVIA